MSFNIGLSGLFAANKHIDVTSNNIANVATTGFKSSRVEFRDQYAQSAIAGGVSTGSGASVGAISQQFTQGNLATGTGNSLDMAINGSGFFMLTNNGEKVYTRAGAFHADREGFIVNSEGMNLQGYNVDASGNLVVGTLGAMRIDTSNLVPETTSQITNSANLNSLATAPALATFDATDTKSYNFKYDTPIYDTQGNEHKLESYFVKTGVSSWSMYSMIDGRSIQDPTTATATPTQLNFDSNGNLITSGTGAPATSGAVTLNVDGTLQVNGWVPGVQTGAGANAIWTANGATGSATGIKLDMAGVKQIASASGLISQTQNGYATGQVSSISVEPSGSLFATYTNGQSKVIGQLSLTTFANVQGLEAAGGANWRETFSSGLPVTGAPRTGTLGSVTGQALEESNVDLASQLVELIKAQSNYQANAKGISTQSTILQTTIQM